MKKPKPFTSDPASWNGQPLKLKVVNLTTLNAHQSDDGAQLFPTAMEPTATTWIAKKPDGTREAIKVTDMTDQHLWRWVQYFRRKWRDQGTPGTDAQLDAQICSAIITAPAIYAEAKKRGLVGLFQVSPTSPDAPTGNAAAPWAPPATAPFGVNQTVQAVEALIAQRKAAKGASIKGDASRKPRVEPGAPGVRHIDLSEDETDE